MSMTFEINQFQDEVREGYAPEREIHAAAPEPLTPWGFTLWQHLHNQHGLTLCESELQEIVRVAATDCVWSNNLARHLREEHDRFPSLIALWEIARLAEELAEHHDTDGFIDSQSHLQNLDRVADAWHDKLEAMREAIKEAHGALETCKVTGPLASEGKWASDHYKFDRLKVKAAITKLQPFLSKEVAV